MSPQGGQPPNGDLPDAVGLGEPPNDALSGAAAPSLPPSGSSPGGARVGGQAVGGAPPSGAAAVAGLPANADGRGGRPPGAAGLGSFEIHERSAGRLEVRGALTFATARKARQQGLELLSATSVNAIEVDCGGVTASDSAGLTVLLDWLTFAKRAGRSLQLKNLPESILAVARISDVTGLLEGGVSAVP